jgi:hypothetical protein
MKPFPVWALVSALLLSAPGFSKTYTTNFDATENPISEGGAWSHTGLAWTKVQTTGGLAYGTQTGSGGYDDSYAFLSGFAADQTAWGVVQRTAGQAGNHEAEILLRWSDDAGNARGYEVLLPYDGQYPPHIVRWNGPFGNFTILKRGDVSVLAKTGDVWKAAVKGNLIVGYLNGTEVIRITDNTYASGGPGMGFYREQGGACGDMAFTSYTATDSLGTGAESLPVKAETRFFLSQNHPNPFKSSTILNYSLPSEGPVTLRIYDLLGREIAVPVKGTEAAGNHAVLFDGSRFSNGVYVARLTAGGLVRDRAIVIAK